MLSVSFCFLEPRISMKLSRALPAEKRPPPKSKLGPGDFGLECSSGAARLRVVDSGFSFARELPGL